MNSVRIIGGAWRRRVLRFPDSEGLRPSPDRVRETLFNWLGQDLSGQTCLDLFAGTGALGFEAASRGATRVILVDKVPRVVAALQENASLLQAGSKVEIIRGDALQYLPSARLKFDVVFLDPPYHKGWLASLAPHLAPVLQDDAAIYAEAEYEIDSLADWHTVRRGKAGSVFFHLLRRETA